MKKFLLSLLITLVTVTGFSQHIKVDTIIKNGVYESHFNISIKEPLFVTYKLYKEIMRSVERLLPSCLDQNFQLWKELKMSEISDKDYLYSADTIKIESIGEIKIHSRNPKLSYSLIRQINI